MKKIPGYNKAETLKGSPEKQTDLLYRNVLDNLLEGCAIIDFNWNYVYANEVNARHAHKRIDEMIGYSLFDVVPGVENSPFIEAYRKTMNERTPQKLESCFTFADGSSNWYEVRSVPVTEGIFIQSIDITQRKQAEKELLESQKQYKALFNAKTNAIARCKIILNEKGVPVDYLVLQVNDAYTVITGLKKEQIEGKTARQAFPGIENYSFNYIKVYGKVALDGTEVNFETYFEPYDKWLSVFAYSPESGEFTVIFADITETKKAEEIIRTNEALLEAFFDASPGILNLFDENYRYIKSDSNTASYFNLDRHAIVGKSAEELSPEYVRLYMGPIMKRVFESNKAELNVEVEAAIPSKSGEKGYWIASYFPVPLPGYKKALGVMGVEITQRKKALDALNESEQKFRALADNISQLAWMADNEGNLFWYNKRWYDYTGTTFEQVKGWGWKIVHHPDYVNKVADKFTYHVHEGKPWEDTFPLKGKDGEYRWFLSRARPVFDNNGKIILWFGTNTDITEQKNLVETNQNTLQKLQEAYNQIQDRLKEKDILVAELYHRTKNNMQVITSLLALKAASIDNLTMRAVFYEMQDRIRAIALVHEQLYQSKNLSKINLGNYIKELGNKLLASHPGKRANIEIRYNLQDIPVLIDTALPCGLIITELMLNSLMHAFPQNRKGYIEVTLKYIQSPSIQLTVSDNGVGFTEGDIDKEDKIGLQIFRTIAEDQLDANVTLNSQNGVCWSIVFNDTLYNERI